MRFWHQHAGTVQGEKGATLLDTIVAIGLLLIVFMGITAAMQLSLDVVMNNRVRAGAIALINERIEYLRSLSYTQIGVEGGIPAGIVPQIETVDWNGVKYTRRTSVMYSDDPQDGLGDNDQNDIIADYKTMRVEVSWNSRSGERSVVLVSRVSPVGVETAVTGGILTINVVDESAMPVPDAQVDIINTETVPAINIRTYTNVNGVVSFIGAPVASNYQITISRPGYSTAQTYPVSAGNPNPTPRHLTVANDETTSATFVIDVVSTKSVETYKQVVPKDWQDVFDTASLIYATSSTAISGGKVVLEGVPPYPASGAVRSVSVSPTLLAGWNTLSFEEALPTGTNITYRVYDASNTLIPDGILPGNSTGFTTSPVDLSAISSVTYPSLRIDAELETADSNETPSIDSWTLNYDYGPEPFPTLTFTMRGSKTIGNNPTVYKYNNSHTTNSSASIALSSIEADTYTLGVASTTGYNLAESCNPQPEALAPNSSQTTKLYVLPYTPNTLLVDVSANGSGLMQGASVQLTKTGYDVTQSTSSCGQTFFDNISSGTYSITVSKTGYQTYTSSSVDISGQTKLQVVLNAQ